MTPLLARELNRSALQFCEEPRAIFAEMTVERSELAGAERVIPTGALLVAL